MDFKILHESVILQNYNRGRLVENDFLMNNHDSSVNYMQFGFKIIVFIF